MYCRKCGKQLGDSVKFCPSCGTPTNPDSPAEPIQQVRRIVCPICHGTNVFCQREQAGALGVGTNRVVVQYKRSKGCLYWMIIGWWLEPIVAFFRWIAEILFGGKKKSGFNVNASKAIVHTVAVCQNCGHSWRIS